MALTQISTQGIKDGTITGSDLATNIDLSITGIIDVNGGSSSSPITSITSSDFIGKFESSDSVGRLIIEDSNSTSNANGLQISGDTIMLICNNETGLQCIGNGAVELYHDNSKKFETKSFGVQVTGELYSDGLRAGDNERLRLGDGEDLQIYHDGANNQYLNITGDTVFQSGTSNSIILRNNADVELYHNGSKKFETTSTGVSVTGAINFDNSTSTSGLVADLWRSTTDHQGNTVPLPNWERPDSGNQGNISGVTNSSGVFSFPKTGIYLIQFFGRAFLDNVTTASQRCTFSIDTTTDNTNFSPAAQGHVHFGGGGFSTSLSTTASASCAILFDVTNVSNQKVRFTFGAGQGFEKVSGNSSINQTYATFTLIGDT